MPKRLNLSKISFKKFGGQKKSDDIFDIRVKKADFLKVAVTVSKKTASKAVDRNRIRRVITEALKRLDIKGEIIVTVKKNISDLKFSDVQNKLANLLEKK